MNSDLNPLNNTQAPESNLEIPRNQRGSQLSTNPRKPKLLILIVLVVLLILIGGAALQHLVTSRSATTTPPNKQTIAVSAKSGSDPNTIRVIATGDFIAHDSLNSQAKKADGSYDYLQFMADFKPIFAAADIRFCNQATISGGESFGISGYPVFNAPTQFAKDMAGLGCNLVNTASNHSFDKGQAAIDATVGVWDKIPNMLAVAGENRSAQEQSTIRYFNVKGLKFAFLAYTTYSNSVPPNSYGLNVFSQQLSASQIATAKQAGADFIIVSMRWGTEYSSNVNAQQTADSQFLADQGVNLIVGHGPHQLQTVSRIKGSSGNETLVWYSLGNFINTQEPPETLFNGLAVMDINKKTHAITSINYLPIYMHYEWTPEQKSADQLAARKNLHLYLLEDANQSLIDKNQLQTTISAQTKRITELLNTSLKVPIISTNQYYR